MTNSVPRWNLLALLGVFGVLATNLAAASLTLVENGKPTSVIVTSDEPVACQVEAAKELQEHLKLMTGATVPIAKENDFGVRRGTVLILVGQSKLVARAGVDTTKLEPETFVVKTVGNALVLAGDDGSTPKHSRTGTLWAVYDFLQDQLGCRWIWPGDLGRVVPRRETVTVEDLDIQETPLIKRRHLRATCQQKHKAMYEKAKLDRFLDLGETYDRLAEDERLWLQRLRRGSSFNIDYGHAFTNWWERYRERYPTIFAMQPDGQRRPRRKDRPDFVKMCVSNPQLWAIQLAGLRSALRKNPEKLWLNACENDGSGGFCVCPRCRAWDADPKAGQVGAASLEVEDGSDVDFDADDLDKSPLPECLSDRYARWYNELAVRAREVHPDAKVIAYAYSNYRDAPTKVDKLEPNLWIGYVGFNAYPPSTELAAHDRNTWHGWSSRGATVFLRSNSLYFAGEGAPYVFTRKLAEDTKWQIENGMRATDYDCLQGYYAAMAPTYYVLARLLWDTDADVDDLLDEFYSAFGSLRDVVREYYDYWEAFTTALHENPNFEGHKRNEKKANYPLIYTPDSFAKAHAILAKGKPLLANASDLERERFRNVELGLEHAELMVEALKAGKIMSTQAGKKLMAFRREIAPRNVLNVYFVTHKEREYRLFE